MKPDLIFHLHNKVTCKFCYILAKILKAISLMILFYLAIDNKIQNRQKYTYFDFFFIIII